MIDSSPVDRDEYELIKRLNAADQQAYNVILKKFYPALCFFCTRLTGDNFTAEEIVQDNFIKLWDKCTDFNSLNSIKAFLYISVRNASMNHIDKVQRKLKREANMHRMEELEQPVITEMIYAETLNEIRMEINALPEQCCKIIKMLYEEDMKPQEIADQLQIKVSTVYNQKMRGMSLLKQRLSHSSFEIMIVIMAGVINSRF
jgi:RNA polymerase sigma-70 factor (ECF subfamily)